MWRLDLVLTGGCLLAGLFAVGSALREHPDNVLDVPLDPAALVAGERWGRRQARLVSDPD